MPNAALAIISEAKLKDYLLAIDHPAGGPKAWFFLAAGYERYDWRRLGEALKASAISGEVTSSHGGLFGHRYAVSGEIPASGGRTLRVVTVWLIPTGTDIPRLITAYPWRAR